MRISPNRYVVPDNSPPEGFNPLFGDLIGVHTLEFLRIEPFCNVQFAYQL